ncbi:unnamed protein product [Sphagnum balticum]
MSAVAAKTVGMQGPVRGNCLGLSLSTFELVVAKRATHLARLSHSHSAVAHVAFRLTNKRVKATISRDAQAYVKDFIDEVRERLDIAVRNIEGVLSTQGLRKSLH